MKIKRVLVKVIPFLFLFSLIFFAAMPKILQREEYAFQATPQQRWTTYFEGEKDECREANERGDKIATDANGEIWFAGYSGLRGLDVSDGTELSHRAGIFRDFAIGPQGQILAVHSLCDNVEGVDVFDGQEWRTYGGLQPLEIEVDGNGRIWVVLAQGGGEGLSEMIINQEKGVATFSRPVITVVNNQINALDADERGNIWAFVSDRLYVFNGEKWEPMPSQSVGLQDVVQTTFDKQGQAWVATACGGVMTYDGRNWDTIIAEDTDTDCRKNPHLYGIDGISFDNQGRAWAWDYNSVKYHNGTNWVTLTPENSGFSNGHFVFDVMIDDLNQVWIATSSGISQSSIEDIPTEKMISQHEQTMALTDWAQGKIWLVPSLLALLWLALYFNMPRSIVLAFIISLVMSILMGPPVIRVFGMDNPQNINPLLVAIFAGILCGLVGCGVRNKSKMPWDIILTIFGFVAGYFLWSFLLFFGNHP